MNRIQKVDRPKVKLRTTWFGHYVNVLKAITKALIFWLSQLFCAVVKRILCWSPIRYFDVFYRNISNTLVSILYSMSNEGFGVGSKCYDSEYTFLLWWYISPLLQFHRSGHVKRLPEDGSQMRFFIALQEAWYMSTQNISRASRSRLVLQEYPKYSQGTSEEQPEGTTRNTFSTRFVVVSGVVH